MKPSSHVIFSVIAMLVSSVYFMGFPAHAETVHDKIRPALVHLKARGQVKEGPKASQFVESFGTGFIVSEDGLVLTVHHLIGDLGELAPETVTVSARIEDPNATLIPAAVVDASITTDLMLLKLSPRRSSYPAVSLGRAVEREDDRFPIFTSGFSEGKGYLTNEGKIRGRSHPGGYLWATSLIFAKGESGSPIYESDGSIIGLVKGNETLGGFEVGYMTPIGFADALLAQVRLRAISAAMKDFDPLRKRFRWFGEIAKSGSSKRITIKYQKDVAGEPHVDAILLKITPIGRRDDIELRVNSLRKKTLKRSAYIGRTGGLFEVSRDVLEVLKNIERDQDVGSISTIELDIVPNLNDGTKLPSERIKLNLRGSQ